ncbi:MAG: hypothetical protein Q9208_001307 [Pyrenodesmia sp. 3 TL-2023]
MSPTVQVVTTTTATTTANDEATPSPLPPHASPGSKTSAAATRPHPKPGYPTCKLRFECHDLSHGGAEVFFGNNMVWRDFPAAVTSVLSTLYMPSQSNSHIPPVRSVTLVLREMDILAYTTGNELDDDHKEIQQVAWTQPLENMLTPRPPSFNLKYIAKIPATPASRQKEELQGVLVHEMVHCWQWNAYGTAPGGLIEGIADFVRLKAGLAPPHWKKERRDSWDQGYQHTGYFLEWIETQYGEGSIRRVNEALMNKRYDEDVFWTKLFSKGVKDLWSEYCGTLPAKDDGAVDAVVAEENEKPKDQLEKVLG